MTGSIADLELIARFKDQLSDLETRIATAPFPFDLGASSNLVARARERLTDVEKLIGLLENSQVGALSYVQWKAGLRETEWPSLRQIDKNLDYTSLVVPKERCRHVTKRGRRCRSITIPGCKVCWSHRTNPNEGVPVKLFRHFYQQLVIAISEFGSRLASKPLENTGDPEDPESRFSWAEEMVCDFALDPNESALYEAYCDLRPFAVEGTIPLWALRTMVFRRATDANTIYCRLSNRIE